MSNPTDLDATPIASVRQLADHIAAGCKPPSAFRIGTEHEKFGFRRADYASPPYEAPDHAAIGPLLERMAADYGAAPILDGGTLIGLKQELLPGIGASVSLEPAGQFELSGGPVSDLHATRAELAAHLAQVRAAGDALGLGFAPLGFHPLAKRADMPWMPKGRYAIMRRYMPLVGTLGLDMMTRTCTVQVNLDYASEADMVRKLRVALRLQPLATALFANSPFTEGRPNGFQSFRAHIWTDTDNARSGIPAVFFEPGFGFERYAQWLVDSVPMYFVYRDGRYIDVAGASFRDFLDGRVAAAAGIAPTLGDFADHMTTVFTDVRLKRFLEMRGADAGTPQMMLAQSALWVGLLYDEAALAAADDLTRAMALPDLLALRAAVPGAGMAADVRIGAATHGLRGLAREVVAIARAGLRARGRRDEHGNDESFYLDPLAQIAEGGPTQADFWLDRASKAWHGDISNIFNEAVT
jgi:glutamate--cysteine ligase